MNQEISKPTYYQLHKKERVEYQKKYFLKNREKMNAHCKKYDLKNRDKKKIYNRKWREVNPDYGKEYYKNNPEIFLNSVKKHYEKYGKLFGYNYLKFEYALQSWSKSVKKRDSNKCQICNSKSDLYAHHLLYKSKYSKLALNINNGTTLCKKHHDEIHHIKCFLSIKREY